MLIAIHCILICWLIIKYRQLQIEGLNVLFNLGYFLLKSFTGFAVYYIYRYKLKQGDIFQLSDEMNILFDVLKHSPLVFLKDLFGYEHSPLLSNLVNWNAVNYNPFFTDNRTFLTFNLLIRIVSFGNIYVNILYINLASYIGLLCLYKSFNGRNLSDFSELKIRKAINWFKFIPFLLPGVIIFGSALSKESLLISALGLFTRSLYMIQTSGKKMHFVYLLLSSLFLFSIKTYLFLALLPGVFALWIYKYSKKKLSWLLMLTYCGGLLILLCAGKLYPGFDFPEYLFGQKLNMLRNAVVSGARTLFDPVLFAPVTWSFIKHIPESILSAFFHPFPWQFKSLLLSVLSFDSFILFAIFIYVFIRRKQLQLKNPSFSGLFFFSALILLMVLGYTVPVLGNLVRYKMPAMLMLGLSLCSLRQNQEPGNNPSPH